MTRAADAIRGSVVVASVMMMSGLSSNFAAGLGIGGAEVFEQLGKRGAMVMTGIFLVFSGNAMPKMLTPLSAARCDGTKTQAFQRFFGWTWVLMGIAYTIAWLILPVEIARPVSASLVIAGILIVVSAMAWLWHTHRRDRTNSPARP